MMGFSPSISRQMKMNIKRCFIAIAFIGLMMMMSVRMFFIIPSRSTKVRDTVNSTSAFYNMVKHSSGFKAPSMERKANSSAVLITQQSINIRNQSDNLDYRSGSIPLHNFPYLHKNGNLCNRPLLYFIYVFTAPGNFLQRFDIRHTWGNNQLFKVELGKVVFLLGNTKYPKIQSKIREEIKLYNDIIQEDYMESYFNITFKGIMALRFLVENCKDVRYVVKVDDDVFLNIFGVLDLIGELERKKVSRSFYCVIRKAGASVVRNPHHRSYVDRKQMKSDTYPKYCDGPTWLYTRDLIDDLYNASWHVPFIPIEDAYTSGLLPAYIGRVSYHPAFGGGWKHPNAYKQNNVSLPMSGSIARPLYREMWRVIISRIEPKQRLLLNDRALNGV